MTIEKKNPNATAIAAASNAIAAINDWLNRIETASFGHSTVALGGGTTKTLTSAEFWDGYTLVLTGTPSGAFTLTVPANKRGPFRLRNNSTQTVTVGISGQPLTKPTVAASTTANFDCDGVNVLAG